MNYGHSLGHAIEALSNYKIPHGLAVIIGVLIENKIAMNRGLLSVKEEFLISSIGKKVISPKIFRLLNNLNINAILPFLISDKKVEGSTLKIATLKNIGNMIFLNLPMNNKGLSEIKKAFLEVVRN